MYVGRSAGAEGGYLTNTLEGKKTGRSFRTAVQYLVLRYVVNLIAQVTRVIYALPYSDRRIT